ncbi:MAG: 3-oxoacyl-ACP reductase FabG [Bryobacterales bacterium]|nr:3-oxoacyl-ACP reductase FabG [Bryobacterales bacterium]
MSRQFVPPVALITGASLGIGAATAREFAKRGYAVAVHFNASERQALEVVTDIESSGGTAASFQADLSDARQCQHLVSSVVERFGRIDVLVNNAGSLIGRRLLAEIDEEFWNSVMALNLASVLWVTQAAAIHMRKRGTGAVVNLGSIAGHNGGGPGAILYATAKAAVTGMTKALAKELIAQGIRVNAVNPGVILTPFHERFSSEERMRDMVSQIPQGRAGKSEEVAMVIAFLASDAASHVVGESVEVNGGMLMD